MNGAALAKIIAFIVHAVRTKTKLPGLHFVLPSTSTTLSAQFNFFCLHFRLNLTDSCCPVFIMAISWIQVLICRFGRNLDHRYLIEQAEYETSVAGDYASIQDSDYRSLHNKTTPIVPQQRRRYGRETEPLLPPSSLSKSFSVAVVPSVPLVAPALKSYATAAGLDDGGSTATKPNATTERTTLPPASQLAKLMRRSLPTKTHIRSLKQISNAFTQRDVILWLRQTFPNVKLEAPEFATHDLLLALLQMGRITSATQPDAIPSEVDIETSLFTFAIAITEEEEPEDEFA